MRFSRNFPPRTIKLWNPIACGLPDQYHLRTFKKRVYCILKGQQRTCEVSGVAYHQAIHLLICPLSHKTNMSKRYLRNTSHFIFFLIDVSGSIESTRFVTLTARFYSFQHCLMLKFGSLGGY